MNQRAPDIGPKVGVGLSTGLVWDLTGRGLKFFMLPAVFAGQGVVENLHLVMFVVKASIKLPAQLGSGSNVSAVYV